MRLKSTYSAKGFGVIEVLVIVVVLAIIGAAAYLYLQQAKSEGTSTGLTKQEQAELKAACKVEIDDELLCSVFSNWETISSEPVTYTTTTTDADGVQNSMVAKYDGDDYHTVMEHDGQTMESMQVANMSYTKMDGVWYKQAVEANSDASTDVEMDSDPASQVNEVINEDNASHISYKRLGEDACGNTTCIKYEITSADDLNNTNFVWIAPKTQKVMRTQLKGSDGTSWDMIYEYGPVTITPPTDAKDFSEMFSM